MRLSPNSSVLIMDETAPIVWLCVSDGLGNVTPTPYDITPHVDAPPVDAGALESRIVTTTRIKCAETDTLSLVLTAGAGTVNNVSVRVIKE